MKRLLHALVAVSLIISDVASAKACTGIRIKPADGSVICARTLEFGTDLQSNIVVIPRGKTYVGSTPGGEPGLRWTTRYATTGANAFGMPITVDGVNERGLAVGLFYFPRYAKYQSIAPADLERTLAPWELGTYLLGTAATVDEALAAACNVRVGEVVQRNFGFVPPCHYVLHDSAGNCSVIEYVEGQMVVRDNPLGVFTNAPTFDWHLTNLRNYTNLRITNVPPVDLVGINLTGFGQGNGLLGLPGDFTPPARFVRAVAFAQSAVPAKSAREGVLQAFHILNQFDIPRGAVREVGEGQEHIDYTLWTGAADLANHRYYFRTFANSRIRMVDLSRVKRDAPEVLTISMAGDEEITDVSDQAK